MSCTHIFFTEMSTRVDKIMGLLKEPPMLEPPKVTEKYARETEEMLINQISQGEYVTNLEGLDVTDEITIFSETEATTSRAESPFVQETVDQGEEVDPDYINTKEEMKSSSSEYAESDSNDGDHKENELALNEESEKRSRRKRSEIDKSKWKKQENYKSREKGLKYKGKKKENGKWNYNIEKDAKKLKPRCNCKLSRNSNTKLKCFSITENARQEIKDLFWKMTWGEKKTYVNTLLVVKPIKRRRGQQEISRRQTSTEFYLKLGCNQTRVCKKMFLNTLCVGEIAVKKWAKETVRNENQQVEKQPESGQGIKKILEFFDSLPKLESHYCRANTSKLYLESLWYSKSQLYRAYCENFCQENNIPPMSRATFSTAFDQKNLSLYQPKKDRCDTCVAFETKNISQEEYDFHIILKNEARQEKANDKDSDNEVFAMDLQSVLLCPKSNVSSLYYKTKLIVHNFTIYDIKRQEGECFLWNETEGKVTANEFASIIVKFLRRKIEANGDTKKDYIIYSDGCAAQNRNCVLANALFNLAIEKGVTIIQKYLQKGHTQMEADSMHSTIERIIRKSKINVPADYVMICKKACLKNPYHVQYLSHDFFRKVEGNINLISAIRPGKRAGDPQVVDLKAIMYTKENVFFKLRHSHLEWSTLPIRLPANLKCVDFETLPPLYRSRLPIKKEKYQHLQELKKSIENDYHIFYDQLPYN